MVIAEFGPFLFSFSCVQNKSNDISALLGGKPLLKGATLMWYWNKQAQLSPTRMRSSLQWWQQAVAAVTATQTQAQASKSLPFLLLFPLHHFPSTTWWTGPGLGPSINSLCDWRHSNLTLNPQNASTAEPWSILLLNHMIWRTCCAPLRSCGMPRDYQCGAWMVPEAQIWSLWTDNHGLSWHRALAWVWSSPFWFSSPVSPTTAAQDQENNIKGLAGTSKSSLLCKGIIAHMAPIAALHEAGNYAPPEFNSRQW